jgi:hypothetical protein
MMPEDEIALNQKALVEIIDDLIRAKLIESGIFKDGEIGIAGLEIKLTEEGADVIRAYAKAFWAIRNTDERQKRIFDLFLARCACDFAMNRGRIAPDDVG